MEILFCGNCGKVLRAEDKFCPRCGEKIPEDGQGITLVLPKGITKLSVRFEENGANAEPDDEIKDIRLDAVLIPEPCYLEGLKYAVQVGTVSISMLQRRLSVGYPKAGHIIAWMEENGFISSFSGTCARKVYLTKKQLARLLSLFGESE